MHLEPFRLNFSSLSFAIRVNLLHLKPSLFPFGLFIPLWCLSTLANYGFKVSVHLKEIFYIMKTTQNIVTCNFHKTQTSYATLPTFFVTLTNYFSCILSSASIVHISIHLIAHTHCYSHKPIASLSSSRCLFINFSASFDDKCASFLICSNKASSLSCKLRCRFSSNFYRLNNKEK